MVAASSEVARDGGQAGRHPPDLGGHGRQVGRDVDADADQDAVPVRRLDPFGQDAAQLPALDLDVIGPADPERGRVEAPARRGRRSPRRPWPAPASARTRRARPCTAGSIARVNVRLPESDHHECSCRALGRGSAARPRRRAAARPLPPDQLRGAIAGGVDLVEARPSSGRTARARHRSHGIAVTRRSLPAQPEQQLAGLDLVADVRRGPRRRGPAARRRWWSPSSWPRSRAASGPCGRGRRRTTATPTTRPGRGAPIWLGSAGSALGVSRTEEASERSATSTSRGWPLSSKKTVRLPSACGSPTASSLTISVLPGSISTRCLDARVRPEEEDRRRQDRGVGIGPLVGGEVGEDAGIEHVAQGVAVARRPAEQRRGLLARRGEVGGRQVRARAIGERRAALEHPLLELRREAARAAGPAAPRRTRPRSRETPARARGSKMSSGVRLLATRNSAMSPTTFELGVTLMMSPKSRLTSEYAVQTSCQRDARPEGLGLLVQVRILAAGHL